MSTIEIKVPNIGEFKDVEVIEVLVSEGQILKKNDPLITIESDKSSVEIPSNFEGKIKSLKLKVGDKVSEGDLILILESSNQKKEKDNEKPIIKKESEKIQVVKPEAKQILSNQNKVIGISLKDRGAILSAGHSADAAYWMNSDGQWISSSFYMDSLPKWLIEYQNKINPTFYLKGKWNMNNSFNYDLDSLFAQKGGGAIKSTPYGNTILKDLAIEIIDKEKLGGSYTTDFLTISFSSTDYIGHQYGPHSDEIKNTYIKLDKDLEDLIKKIENKIGYENTLIFLTADHGVVSEPSELLKRKIPGGYYNKNQIIKDINDYLQNQFNWPNKEWGVEFNYVLNFSNYQIFLDKDLIKNNLGYEFIEKSRNLCADYLLKYDWIKNTYTSTQLHNNEYNELPSSLVQKGYNQKRSGDIIINPQSGWISYSWRQGGTTHGSCFSYDTHVPLIFWGGNVRKGKTDRKIYVKDIAPTICLLLGISYPNGCTGNPIFEVTE